MSKKLLAFLLSELTTVRIICQMGCGAVVEIPIESLDEKYTSGKCPVCGNAIQPVQSNHLVALAQAVRGLTKAKSKVEIEFVLPDNGSANE